MQADKNDPANCTAMKLLVLQHVAHELLGTLNPLLKRAVFRIRYVNFARHPDAQPILDGYDGLIVLGGPMSVNDASRLPHLTTEMRLIEAAIRRDLPLLGICLGAQLIAKTLGGEVYPNPEKEIGWYDVSPTENAGSDRLLLALKSNEKIFQWHGETFEIPRTSSHLAFSALCANQAFRYGEKVYGLQFHLEVDEAMIHRWLRVPENQKEISSLRGDCHIDQIYIDTTRHMARLSEISEHVFTSFIDLFGIEKRFRCLPSR
jgi:GMP synthase (glutamine-hydrolysing)